MTIIILLVAIGGLFLSISVYKIEKRVKELENKWKW